jgi:hypothetical protein
VVNLSFSSSNLIIFCSLSFLSESLSSLISVFNSSNFYNILSSSLCINLLFSSEFLVKFSEIVLFKGGVLGDLGSDGGDFEESDL